MIAVIDYGASNLRSVMHALGHLGVDAHVAETPDGLHGRTRSSCRAWGLSARAWSSSARAASRPRSSRPWRTASRCWASAWGCSSCSRSARKWAPIPGWACCRAVLRFPEGQMGGLKVPHMGWNQLTRARIRCCWPGLPTGLRPAYTSFVHSYYCAPADPADVLATTDYGLDFASVVARSNVYGVQFHPEKSQASGLRILRNFVDGVAAHHIARSQMAQA